MARPSNAVIAGAGVAFVAAVGLMLAGQRVPQVAQDRMTSRVPWGDGGRPAGAECMWTDAFASDGAKALFGLDADAGPYVRVKVCAAPVDGGMDYQLPPGMEPLEDTYRVADGGEYAIEAYQGSAAPFLCACRMATGACHVTGEDGGLVDATFGNTLPAGTWTGSGCQPKACQIFGRGGDPSWPSNCPESAP